jgi:hypothetical protein
MEKQQKPKLTLEEMKALHPLVKDERYFKTSYFPDTVPECFKENEEK